MRGAGFFGGGHRCDDVRGLFQRFVKGAFVGALVQPSSVICVECPHDPFGQIGSASTPMDATPLPGGNRLLAAFPIRRLGVVVPERVFENVRVRECLRPMT
jgi:hypothetical protein